MTKTGRNEPCPCGSGKKYKQCCQAKGTESTQPQLSAPALIQAGLRHHQEGNLPQAEDAYRQALKAEPDNPDALHLLGVIAHQVGRNDIAEDLIAKAIEAGGNPSSSMYCNLGLALQALGKIDAAIESFHKALAITPNFVEAHYNMGNALKANGEAAAAIECYRRALAINPGFAPAYSNLGNALQDLGDLAAAVECYVKATSLNPGLAHAYNDLGLALQEQGRIGAAIENYRKAIALDPGLHQTHYNLGNAFKDLGDPQAAIASYNTALALKPDYAEAHVNLAGILRYVSRYQEALQHARRALELNPELAAAHQGVAMISGYMSDYAMVTHHCDQALARKPDDLDFWENRLYMYSYHPTLSVEEIFAQFVRWGNRYPTPATDTFASRDRTRGRRLRVGYVSPDFRRHTSRFFFEPLFARHDRSQVELFAYSNVRVEDEFTQRFKGMFDTWRNIRGISDADAAQLIRNDKIDILVDGCNHMLDHRLAMFALKPAPLQVTWLGAAWTTGLPAMDYVLLDRYEAPEGTLAREKIVRLPGSFFVYRAPDGIPDVAPLPAERNGFITFGYSGRSERLNHRVFAAWSDILQRLPAARLILDFGAFADPPTQEHYRRLLAGFGIDPARVDMRRSANIYHGLGDFDILLDSFPHNGGTMIVDSLWMGVPALTLASRPPVGRIGTSMMSNIGLEDWVATSESEYIEKAVRFASDIGALAALRTDMRRRMMHSPMMDETRFAREVEAAFRIMWQRWCEGLPAEDIGSDRLLEATAISNKAIPEHEQP